MIDGDLSCDSRSMRRLALRRAAVLLLWAATATQVRAEGPARAAPPAGPGPAGEAAVEVPVDIIADRLWYDSRAGVLVLEGHVIADRAGARQARPSQG
jgi:hypothetical protein